MADLISATQNSISTVDPIDHLPLPLLRSDVIPPAPNRSGPGSASVIDWLPDFRGRSWIAYGASSLLVISHFPSPTSPEETLIGPIFRQVFELSGLSSATVATVSWSSEGDVAAASENSISVLSHDSRNTKGSFCWSQTAVLVQSTKVETIKWTGSGDGLVAGGIEVVLWKHRSKAWEIAWKFKTAQPQTLVSTTWFIEGPSASAVYPSELTSVGSSINEASKTVSVWHSDGKSEYKKTELHHPQPVLMVQWRPSIKRQLDRDAKHSARHVLLTCCLDGTVRLWTEIDTGRVRKVSRDISEPKTMRHSYCVVAVIEINQILNGTLGINVFVTWATEIGGILRTDEHDNTGRCEWLVGFGPGTSATFWAIHCLDDVSPMRFPRVTLWKRPEAQGLETGNVHRFDCSIVEDLKLINKVVIQRNCSSGPPATFSSVHSLRSNALVWSHLYNGTSNGAEDVSINRPRTETSLACSTHGDLHLDGHAGKILQVVIHPSRSEVELAVSIDSNGLMLFWSISSITNYDFGLPVFLPSWKICGKHETQVTFPKYVSLTWTSLILDEDRVLLMGHVGGVDCFVVKFAQGQEGNIGCHKLCTIPFIDYSSREDGPTDIFCSHLPSTCNETLRVNRFMLLGIWMNGFQALSWEVSLHSCDINEGCCYCNVDSKNDGECNRQNFKNVIAGKKYCLDVNPCSPRFPDPHTYDHVTSFAVICPGSIFPSIQKNQLYTDFPWSNGPAYIIATGCSDGSLKLWRSNSSQSLTSRAEWELLGMFVAHHGPVRAICLTDCGRKIATVGAASNSAKMDTLNIWDSIPLAGTGCFMLEETISVPCDIVDLNWLTIGNGRLFLGVCTQNELRIYGQQHCGNLPLLHSGRSEKIPIWTCIAFAHIPSPISQLLWGPRASAVVVHDNYFCLFSQWLLLMDRKHHDKFHPNYIKHNLYGKYAGMDNDIIPAIFTDSCICDVKELSIEDSRESCKCRPQIHQLCSSLFASRTLLKYGLDSKLPFWSMTELSEKLCGALPVYHPNALLMNIYSGNWKRACRAVQHLIEFINSKDDSGTACSSTKSNQIIPQIPSSQYFEGNHSKTSTSQEFLWCEDSSTVTSSQFQEDSNQFAYSSYSDASSDKLNPYSSKSKLSSFTEPIKKLSDLAGVNDTEKIQLLAIIDILGELSNPDSASVYKSLDEPGQRFWIAVRFQQLYSFRRFGRLPAVEELDVGSGMIGWAFHSDCQENLFGSLLPNEPSWQEMRALGIGFWFTNATQLRAKMEKLARSQFLKKRDPKDCALLYIALKRIQVLAGLFKLSKDEKDKPLVGFLSRNFQEEKNKAAALKNAYVLMGRHQLELAVAFFLLGGDTSSAITVCAKNLGDEQLALVICRLVEGQGGPLEHHLITKYILPSAIEKHDYWLASVMEWQIGNYSQSFVSMLGFQMNSAVDMLTFSSNQVAFLDPSIGLYCLTLATKNSMRNAVGEQNALILSRWATLMTATALNRCGLPLESLECHTSPLSGLGGIDQGSLRDSRHSGNIHQILKPSPNDSTNWMLGDVAYHLESHAKLDLALQYFSKLVKEHPSWPDFTVAKVGSTACSNEFRQHKILLDKFQHKFQNGLRSFDQKFSVSPASLVRLVLIFLCNNGIMFIGHDLMSGYTSEDYLEDGSNAGTYQLNSLLCTLLLKVTEEVSSTCSRYITACGTNFYQPNTYHIENDTSAEVRSRWLDALGYSSRGLMMSVCELRAVLEKSSGSLEEDLINKPLSILDLYEYYIHFAAAWVQKNSKHLIMMVQPLLITCTNGHSPYELDIGSMKKILCQILESATYTVANDDVGTDLKVGKCLQEKPDKKILHTLHSVPEDERWQIVGVCLWQHMSNLMNDKLKLVSDELEDNAFPSVVSSSWASCLANIGLDRDSLTERIKLVSLKLAKTLSITLLHVSSSNMKQFASLLRQKAENGLNIPAAHLWLESTQSIPGTPYQHQNQDILTLDMLRDLDELSVTELLQDMFADPKIISEGFAQAKLDVSHSSKHKPSEKWSEIYKGIIEEHETEVTCDHEGMLGSSEAGSPSKDPFMNGHTLRSSWHKDNTPRKEVTIFQNPREVYKRNGELLEAICINSIDQRQAALASNRKGIVFFTWEDGMPSRDHSDYIWSVSDWPQNGWADSESTPVPIFASPGVGLGSKKGAHVGLGGATTGVGFMARPGRDLMVGGTFGLPGYASIGASGLGWGIQEDFEEFSDPAPTIGNISTRALYSHPSRPFFLVGSSNTHIYLWEFGKNIATATYGVLPAVNVPPPYALASVSAVQFDHCGHRFATAALDGTVSTWQLEVGGRSNIRPTESSPCFSSYTSDVTYITSSGSIIAASGYSSNGANVVIWDTLAPPSTSRASIICHEGGARSLSVFDNDIGSGSVSPLILTGGKGGDVGLHDFRYIATGRTKRHKHSGNGEHSHNISSSSDMHTGTANKPGDQNPNGMLWYIPKAHSGSVTKISTIPNTSLFLTGSKDGDVKLWDAKKAELVYHWPKLHERHTFLQPSSRGYGGVVRAAVTDIQVLSNGFLTCGGDGHVKLIQLNE